MSDRGSNSGSQSLTSSRKEIIEYEDVTPGKSASQAESSVSRASEVARRAAAEVRARAAQRRAARELQIAALRDEIVEIEAEGTKEALEVEEEVFQRELRKTGSPSRRSVSEPRGVRSWAPSSSHQSIIPRNLFGEKEGESQVTVAEESRAARPEEPLGLFLHNRGHGGRKKEQSRSLDCRDDGSRSGWEGQKATAKGQKRYIGTKTSG